MAEVNLREGFEEEGNGLMDFDWGLSFLMYVLTSEGSEMGCQLRVIHNKSASSILGYFAYQWTTAVLTIKERRMSWILPDFVQGAVMLW